MGRLAFYMAGHQHDQCLSLWAEREDVLLEMPWGIYDGTAGLRHYYLQELGSLSDPAVLERIRGTVTIQDLDTEVLEVASDGLSARGCWTSPGFRTDLEAGHPQAKWSWCKLAADFLFTDAGWKLWRMRVYNLYLTNYEQCWTQAPLQDFDAMAAASLADRPYSETPWQYTMAYPTDQPDPPLPYQTYSQGGLTFSTLPKGGTQYA